MEAQALTYRRRAPAICINCGKAKKSPWGKYCSRPSCQTAQDRNQAQAAAAWLEHKRRKRCGVIVPDRITPSWRIPRPEEPKKAKKE